MPILILTSILLISIKIKFKDHIMDGRLSQLQIQFQEENEVNQAQSHGKQNINERGCVSMESITTRGSKDQSEGCRESGKTNTHESHQVFEATGVLKPSMFANICVENEEDYVYQSPKVQKKEPETKSVKRTRRRRATLHTRKQFCQNSSDEDNNDDIIPSNKTRRFTVDLGKGEDDFSVTFPQLPKIQITPQSKGSRSKMTRKLQSKSDFDEPDEDFQQRIDINKCQLLFMGSDCSALSVNESSPEVAQKKRTAQLKKLSGSWQNLDGTILHPTPYMLQRQKSLNQSTLCLQFKTNFVYEALRECSMATFDAIVQDNSLLNRKYSFWLNSQKGNHLLMMANKHVKLLEDFYIITEYLQNRNSFNFMAKMDSNLARNEFVLTNQPQYTPHTTKTIYADFNFYRTVQGRPSISALFPRFDSKTHKQMVVNVQNEPEILKQLRRMKNEVVDSLGTSKLDSNLEWKFMKEHRLIQTRKTIALVDKNGVVKVYIGKTQSKKYKIKVGSGVSPLIVFALFIVLIQS